MPEPSRYSLEDVSQTPGVFRLSGEIDESNVDNVETELSSSVGHRRAVVDLSSLRFIDSAGFKMLLSVGTSREIALVLSPTAVPRRAMEVLGLKALIPVFDSTDEATKGFLSP